MNKKYLILIVLLSLVICILAVSLVISNYREEQKMRDYERAAEAENLLWLGYGGIGERNFQNYILGTRIENGKLHIAFGNFTSVYSYDYYKLIQALEGYEDVIVINAYNEEELRELIRPYNDLEKGISVSLNTHNCAKVNVSIVDLDDDNYDGNLDDAYKVAQKIWRETGITPSFSWSTYDS